ncbi:DUF305 domain-containing protein [Streptomyces sp. NPDC006326]|uniref:DUF305 domain-containing protein n=1 Tax=Streptomyces sp. NPDC006326 TaxID=3156752 RepID=UPI0033BF8007
MTTTTFTIRTRTRTRSLVALATATTALVLTLSACGSGTDGHPAAGHEGPTASAPAAPAQSPGAGHNAADVAFAQGMIPHHRQAVEMAGLAASRAESAEVKKLADEIKKAQDPEINAMSGWLTSWGEQVPAPGAADHSAHGGGGTPSGMMTAEDMARLEKASGKAFDTAFLELMVKHHEGAVAMADTERKTGSHAPAKTMAEAITTSQSAEITHMRTLLRP